MKTFKYKINGNEYEVAVDKMDENEAEVTVNGTSYKVELEKKEVEVAAPKVQRNASAPSANKPAGAGAGTVKSPLPGIIIDVCVNVGDEVKKGQTIMMLEAMKMENAIHAPLDGKVTAISVAKGDSVLEGVVLLAIS